MNYPGKKPDAYSWDDIVEVRHSSGQLIPVKLSSIKDSDYVWYTCSSCGESTTLAWGQCGACGNPFEPLDLKEAKKVFPTVALQETNPDRVVYLLLHRAWICLQCTSYNVNYPRSSQTGDVWCVNCWHVFERWNDLLLEDSDILLDSQDTVANFRERILALIESRQSRRVDSGWVWYWIHQSSTVWWFAPASKPKVNSLQRNKWGIVTGILSAGLLYTIYYGFIEEIGTEISIVGHDWERNINIEGFIQKKSEWWKKDITPSSFHSFRVINQRQKEAPWDSYEVQIGTKSETDYSKCTSQSKICTTPKTTLSTWVTVSWSEQCTTICNGYGTKSVPVMDKRYRSHPYIEFAYMDWSVVKTHPTAWSDKEPYWHNTESYKFDNTTIRLWSQSENYKVKVVSYKWEKDTVKLPQWAWMKLNEWDTCPAKATRWWWVISKSVVELLNSCHWTWKW